MLKVLYGNEPYRIEQCKKSVQKNITSPEFNCSVLYGAYDGSVDDIINTLPFLADKRAVILTVDTLKEIDNKLFMQLLENPVPSTDCLIVVRNFDGRLKLAKLLKKKGLLYPCEKYSDSELPAAVASACGSYGARITSDAVASLISRTAYLDVAEVTFLDVADWIKKMAAVTKEITLSVVESTVPQKEQPDAFILATLIRDNQYEKLQKEVSLLSGMSTDEVIKSLSALLWQYRISYKAKMFSPAEIGVRSTVLADLPEQALVRGISILNGVLAKVKTGTMPAELAIQFATSLLIA